MALKKEDIYDFIEKAKHVLLEGKEEVLRSSQIGKILLKISSYNREKNNLLRDVGLRLYKMDHSKLELPKSFEAFFKQLVEIDAHIAENEAKISELKKQHGSKNEKPEKSKEE